MSFQKDISIDWSNPNVIDQFVQHIKTPLETIIETSNRNKSKLDNGVQYEVIFSSSKQISDIIENMLNEMKSKSVKFSIQDRPKIFDIYEDNQNVQKMCSNKITPEKVIKIDQDWLVDLEKAIDESINENDISLYELSYKMAVSERQLHRKVEGLVYLTPNKYVRILRLHKAKQMIEEYIQNSISQIAYAVGYNDVHYFSKLFSAQYNITPKELINSLR